MSVFSKSRHEPDVRPALSLVGGHLVAVGRFDMPFGVLLRDEIVNTPELRLMAEEVDLGKPCPQDGPLPTVMVIDANRLLPARRLILARSFLGVPILAIHGVDGPGRFLRPGLGVVAVTAQADGVEHVCAAIAALAQLAVRTQRLAGSCPAALEPRQLADLTDRELEVCQLICEGYEDAEIAWRLQIAEGTAKTHAKHIYRKLGMNRHELTAPPPTQDPERNGSEAGLVRLDSVARLGEGRRTHLTPVPQWMLRDERVPACSRIPYGLSRRS